MRKYGLKGITSLGRKMVRSGAHVLEQRFGRQSLTFLTITVPAMGREDRRKVAVAWGDLMRQVVQRLSRKLESAGQPKLVVSVTELQSARAKKYSQAYLHAHLVYPSRSADRSRWVIEADDFRAWWKKRIESKIGHPLDRLPRVELKVVRKSAEGYLGKYMTKGAGEMGYIVDDIGEESVPGQQWNMSGDLRKVVKETTVRSFAWGEYVQMLLDAMVAGYLELEGYWKRVEIDIGGRVLTTAWIGNLTAELRKEYGLPWLDTSDRIAINGDLKVNLPPVKEWRTLAT